MTLLSFLVSGLIDWGEVGATAISSVGVLIAVSLLRALLPVLKERYEWMVPLIAMFGPMALAALAESLSGVLGHPVDLSELIDLLREAGPIAVVIHQTYKQATKTP